VNLQLDHFSENENTQPILECEEVEGRLFFSLLSPVLETQQSNQPPFLCDDTPRVVAQLWWGAPPLHGSNSNAAAVEHGSHNVSRWMTWLPISLKNAAKCDNWYELQNHSITESLNAKGAREKPSKGDPRACRIAQCRTKTTHPSESLSGVSGFSVG